MDVWREDGGVCCGCVERGWGVCCGCEEGLCGGRMGECAPSVRKVSVEGWWGSVLCREWEAYMAHLIVCLV